MTYRGIVKSGMIVVDGLKELPEGASVTVVFPEEVIGEEEQIILTRQRQSLLRLIELGKKTGQLLPPDASRNVDHYLYGAPKQ